MKFIHIADLHLDTPLISLKNNRELIKKRRTEHRQIFKDTIKLAKNENVDFLFISGDLFEQKFIEKNTVEYIISSLELIPDIKVFISPGNHDPLIKNSPYKTFKWPDNVVILDKNIKKFSFENIDIYGFGFEDFEMTSNELNDFKVEDSNKINVLITHATLNGNSKYNDVTSNNLKQFDYVALGHIHKPKIDDCIVYPGALVACGFDECGEHGLVIGTLEKDNVKYEFKNMEYRHFNTIEVDISNIKSANDILDLINLEDDIYRIKLRGDKNVDIKDIREIIISLNKDVCEIIDETHLPYDLEKIATQKNLKGIFTKRMLKLLKESPENSEEILKAIEITYSFL